jgi:hypothetical protein
MVQCSIPFCVHCVGIGALCEQELHRIRGVGPRSYMEGRPPFGVLGVDVRSAQEE